MEAQHSEENRERGREGDLWWDGGLSVEAVLVHDPVGALALGGAAGVEDEGLLHADGGGAVADLPVLAGGLPVAAGGGAVGAGAVGVLAVEAAEEVPLGVAAAEAGAGGEVPWLHLVQVHLRDGVHLERPPMDLPLQDTSSSSVGWNRNPGARDVASAAAAGGAEEDDDEGWLM
uniref:DUF834 domain-containing protein n=1 Tax=Oryza meridionalis TaxID=40149 RepID=A0A0E0EP35_9ORYZ